MALVRRLGVLSVVAAVLVAAPPEYWPASFTVFNSQTRPALSVAGALGEDFWRDGWSRNLIDADAAISSRLSAHMKLTGERELLGLHASTGAVAAALWVARLEMNDPPVIARACLTDLEANLLSWNTLAEETKNWTFRKAPLIRYVRHPVYASNLTFTPDVFELNGGSPRSLHLSLHKFAIADAKAIVTSAVKEKVALLIVDLSPSLGAKLFGWIAFAPFVPGRLFPKVDGPNPSPDPTLPYPTHNPSYPDLTRPNLP